MATNPDFSDLLSELSKEGAEFIVVGAHAVMFHTTSPRYTKDLDIWTRPTTDNAKRVLRALETFGAPLADLSVEDLAVEGTIFQIGVEPNRIDVITSIEGVRFESAFPRCSASTYGGVPIRLLSIDDLLTNKRAVARAKDLVDVEALEAVLRSK